MQQKTLFRALIVLLGLGFFTACAMLSPNASFAPSHPQELSAGKPMCSECHTTDTFKGAEKPFAAFDHTDVFVKDHKFLAGKDAATCATCHAPSFCSDCHGGKVPMKPSTLAGDRPDRTVMPHRGDYLTLHKIEGKMDPTGCFKCHGRANNDKCRACHR